jgi:hypothetical protein
MVGEDLTEDQVIEEFVQDGPLKDAHYRREVSVGGSLATSQKTDAHVERTLRETITRSIDLVAETSERFWIIEAKKEYRSTSFDTAIGQALVSKRLYELEKDTTEKEIQATILLGDMPSLRTDHGNGAILHHLVRYLRKLDVEVIYREGPYKFHLASNNLD